MKQFILNGFSFVLLTAFQSANASDPIVFGFGSSTSCRRWAEGCFTDFEDAVIRMRLHAKGACGHMTYTRAEQLETEECTTTENIQLHVGTTECHARFVCKK